MLDTEHQPKTNRPPPAKNSDRDSCMQTQVRNRNWWLLRSWLRLSWRKRMLFKDRIDQPWPPLETTQWLWLDTVSLVDSWHIQGVRSEVQHCFGFLFIRYLHSIPSSSNMPSSGELRKMVPFLVLNSCHGCTAKSDPRSCCFSRLPTHPSESRKSTSERKISNAD